jgi:hypothetical protein
MALMASKVFLFNETQWLYCSNVTFEDGVYHGWVVNGAWKMSADTTKDIITYEIGVNNAKLTWACDPTTMYRDYSSVIEDAKTRYESGEPANYILKPNQVYEDEDDEVAF